MPYPNWSADEIAELKKLTKKSGRVLEVRTADAFASKEWMVHLSTYYVDIISQKPRELDVLAHRRTTFNCKGQEGNLVFHALISCKGFAPEQYPICWSQAVGLSEAPRVMCARAGPVANGMRELAWTLGRQLAHATDSTPYRHLLGIKVFEKKGAGFDFVRDRDNELYDGADSALKAAAWHYDQRFKADVEIYVPIVLLDKKLTHVSIGRKEAGAPSMVDRGYLIGLYPFGGLGNEPTWQMTLVWTADDVSGLIKVLDDAIEQARGKLAEMAISGELL